MDLRDELKENIMVDNSQSLDKQKIVKILYTNYRGETAVRLILPDKIWFGKTEWHPDEQWLLDAYDIHKQAKRSFALREIQQWSAE